MTLLALIFISVLAYAQPKLQPGLLIKNPCLEGESQIYLLANNVAIEAYYGGYCRSPWVTIGTWSVKNNDLYFHFTTAYEEEGFGKIIHEDDMEIEYEKYKAIKKSKNRKFRISRDTLIDPSGTCQYFEQHNYKMATPQTFLHLNFKEKYPFTKTRLVTHSDIANLSKQELRLMRNEIFARYGLIFNSADLKKYFNSLEGYTERLNDVTAFLNDIETKNIDFIKSYE